MSAWTIFALCMFSFCFGAMMHDRDADETKFAALLFMLFACAIVLVRMTLFFAIP